MLTVDSGMHAQETHNTTHNTQHTTNNEQNDSEMAAVIEWDIFPRVAGSKIRLKNLENSELDTEPKSHSQLPIPQHIANAGRQGFQWGKACSPQTKYDVG